MAANLILLISHSSKFDKQNLNPCVLVHMCFLCTFMIVKCWRHRAPCACKCVHSGWCAGRSRWPRPALSVTVGSLYWTASVCWGAPLPPSFSGSCFLPLWSFSFRFQANEVKNVLAAGYWRSPCTPARYSYEELLILSLMLACLGYCICSLWLKTHVCK